MSQHQYTHEVLKVVVAKICQTIGWHSIQSTPLEIMVDILRRYITELAKLTHAYSTQFGHTSPNLDELGLAFRDMHINIADLEEYIRYVESVASIEVPRFPIPKESHLNFLKPGSSEVLTRLVHIHEHLPPMLPEVEESEAACPVTVKQEETQSPLICDVAGAGSGSTIFKRPADISPNENPNKRPRLVLEEEGRPTREISSVMMTTSGFLSPAREGKLPESRTPHVNTIDSPSSSINTQHLHPLNMLGNETKFERKPAKLVKDLKKTDKRKEKAGGKELFKSLQSDDSGGGGGIGAKKFTTMKDVVKLKALKANAAAAAAAAAAATAAVAGVSDAAANNKVSNQIRISPVNVKQTKAQQKAIKNEKTTTSVVGGGNSTPIPIVPAAQAQTQQTPAKLVPNLVPNTSTSSTDKVIDGKLSSEPDKSKLNIFKKISKVKDDKLEKVDKTKNKDESISVGMGSRGSSPDLIIDEPDMKIFDMKMAAAATAAAAASSSSTKLTETQSQHPGAGGGANSKAAILDVANKIYENRMEDDDRWNDDDLSPPGTPSTPKTPEMPLQSHSPPLSLIMPLLASAASSISPAAASKLEKEVKKKRKEKNKVRNRTRTTKYNTMSPRPRKGGGGGGDNNNFDTEMERPKTPDDPINLVKDEAPSTTASARTTKQSQQQPSVFSFFPNFLSGPGLIPSPMTNPLFPRLPALPKHGFGQPAHIPSTMPTLPQFAAANNNTVAKQQQQQPPAAATAAEQQQHIDNKPPAPVPTATGPVTTPSTTSQQQQSQSLNTTKTEKQDAPVIVSFTTTKEKHKKDKKDKPKKKNKKDKIKNKSEKRKLKEEKKEKDKEKTKKEKKDKKKEKEKEQHEGSVPKLTLKISSPRPPTPDVHIQRKIMIKPVVKKEDESLTSASANLSASGGGTEIQDVHKREPSPELARISALITRPPKLKASKESHVNKDETATAAQRSSSPKQNTPLASSRNSRMNSSNANKGASAASAAAAAAATAPIAGVKTIATKQKSILLKQQEAAALLDNDGNKVWICPACGGQDDGSPMIGCDDCDAWYHWVCVGIQVPPDANEDWYCRICIVKKQETLQIDKKKKRKKKEKKDH